MKKLLLKIWDDGLISLITPAMWDFIRFTNAAGLVAIIILFVVSVPGDIDPDDFSTWILFAALQLAIALLVSVRTNKIEALMLKIDAENDRRDNATSKHIEVVLQDVQWLVRKELERIWPHSLDDDIKLREVSESYFDSRDIPS